MVRYNIRSFPGDQVKVWIGGIARDISKFY